MYMLCIYVMYIYIYISNTRILFDLIPILWGEIPEHNFSPIRFIPNYIANYCDFICLLYTYIYIYSYTYIYIYIHTHIVTPKTTEKYLTRMVFSWYFLHMFYVFSAFLLHFCWLIYTVVVVCCDYSSSWDSIGYSYSHIYIYIISWSINFSNYRYLTISLKV